MGTVWGAGDFWVLGATLIKPRPLRRTFVPLEPGLSVLYGRNGAGKSRVLEGLEAAVTGTAGRAWAWLHVRIRTDVPADGGGLVALLVEALDSRPKSVFVDDETPSDAGERAKLRNIVSTALRREWENWEVDPAALLAEEIAEAGVLTLIPVGGDGQHQWQIFASSLPSDTTPLLSQRASQYREEWIAALTLPDSATRWTALNEAADRFGMQDKWDLDETEPPPFSDPEQPELLLELGQLTLPTSLCDVYGPPRADLNEETLQRVIHLGGSRRSVLLQGTDQPQPAIIEDLEHLSNRASGLYAMVLERAPRLLCKLAPVEKWLTAPALTWTADDIDGPTDLPLSELSQAQQRWAGIAIAATLIEYQATGGRAVMLLDEPELALHSLAVRTMASGLQQLAKTINVDILAATHSAALLEETDVHLLHVTRGGGGDTVVHRMVGVHEKDARRLGMSRADLLQLTRVFVIVEGLHDQIVIEETCGDELSEARARIIPLRGATNAASLMDAQFLLRFTDAVFLIVLDAIPPDDVEAAWTAAREEWKSRRNAKATEIALKTALPAAVRIENKFLRELMLSSIVSGNDERLRFRTLPQPDVIYYLPLAAFTAKRHSWQSLHDEHATMRTNSSFKDWLEQQHGFSFDDEQIRSAAGMLDQLHPDIIAIADELHSLARGH